MSGWRVLFQTVAEVSRLLNLESGRDARGRLVSNLTHPNG